ncbi:DUF924-domain-containing protein [Aspergillus ellipticus CBS 707.79]|uniref:DUF924-domain-containing protein n=1 Tax=Aspergillus ellipticus CBS 707.79 TaxID=1448320 RepID=A0A319D1G9_9EURO|nr:DUF924-domain-containing protein [Aspergillus ellipticus CBS 707.79]
MNAPVILNELYRFWFSHVKEDEHLTLPTWNDNKRWFMRDAAFDQECLAKFSPILATLQQTNAAKSSILETFNPQTALDWLSLTILLDQLPRNCYRDADSAIVFTFFDPLAQAIAEEALSAGIPASSPEIRYRLALRFWFYLPSIHSEDLGVQDRAAGLYEGMFRDVNAIFGDNHSSIGDGKEREYCETLRSRRVEVEEFCALHRRVQKDHLDQIVRFGRYPHRNAALGRVSTPEEEGFLKEGRTFG